MSKSLRWNAALEADTLLDQFMVKAYDEDSHHLWGDTQPPLWEDETTNPKDLVGITKPQVHLVPPALVLHVARAMADGAEKYGAYNWRTQPVRGTIYVSAALRHIYAYLDGEDLAQDSGHHHLAHAAACLGILLDAQDGGNLKDDRATPGPAPAIIERFTEGKS